MKREYHCFHLDYFKQIRQQKGSFKYICYVHTNSYIVFCPRLYTTFTREALDLFSFQAQMSELNVGGTSDTFPLCTPS